MCNNVLMSPHAVSFRRARVMSVPSAESSWLALDPGTFMFILCAVSAASQHWRQQQTQQPIFLRNYLFYLLETNSEIGSSA